mmetsp:Transcript_23415/g.48649  ORF Transcript_23415/g.48649 Transcript_23415/m.48649 type:complete len:448 (+) Transcript_23415:87-1430(+)
MGRSESGASSPLLSSSRRPKSGSKAYRLFYFVAFLANFTPSSPYLTIYLEEGKGLSEDTINDKVWPTSTYAMLALTVPVAVLSVRLPRLFLSLGIICRIAAYLLLLFGVGLSPMVTVEILYAAFLVIDSNVLVTCACLYATEEQYAKAAVGVGVSRELALVSSSLLGQLLHDFTDAGKEITFLFVISLCSCLGAFAVFMGTLAGTRAVDWRFVEEPNKPARRFELKSAELRKEVGEALNLPLVVPISLTLVGFYASFLLSADYNFMILTKDGKDSWLGVIEASQDLAGAFGSLFAGWIYERNDRQAQTEGGKSMAFLLLLAFGSTLCYLHSAIWGAEHAYWATVLCVVLPWGSYHCARTFATCIVSTALGEVDGVSFLPLLLGGSTFLALGCSSVAQLTVAEVEGTDEKDFFTGCAVVGTVLCLGIAANLLLRRATSSSRYSSNTST